MTEGVTASGFAFQLDDAVLDDYDMLEILVELDKGHTARIIDFAQMLLGKEQHEQLKNHLRQLHGRVPATVMVAEVMEIFKACKAAKNC